MKNFKKGGTPSASFIVGSVALLFLVIGYQSALFIHKASVARIVANHDRPDTVFVAMPVSPEEGSGCPDSSLRSAPPPAKPAVPPLTSRGWLRSGLPEPAFGPGASDSRRDETARAIWRANTRRRYESFRFDPNTASIDDLMRLGFSLRQAQAIDNYRKKGGRFRRKADFARSYVVEDSVYRRLEKYIDIPRIDINRADSAAFETLPGIGKFFAARMVSYREELGGYSYPEQLLDIWHFDREKYDGLKDLIVVGPGKPYPLWTLTEKELARHPYIGKRAAHGIVIFRDNTPPSDWSVGNIIKAGILDPGLDEKLSRCVIAPPPSP